MPDTVISINNVSKSFKLYKYPMEKLKEFLHPFRKKYHKPFWALKDISFEVKKGESVGIIGRNGSGKSTLLQLICGILQPTEGTVKVNGRVSAILELGAGFSPEFTGRENVYLNGAIMRFTKTEIDKRFDSIASFADIGDFIDQPVKRYSSGMFVRLAFACAVSVEPDILVVDEALAVGDLNFQAKCINKIYEMQKQGVTLIFVSHSMEAVIYTCKKGLLLESGKMTAYGDTQAVIGKYTSRGIETIKDSSVEDTSSEGYFIHNFAFENQSESKDTIKPGDPVKVSCVLETPVDLRGVIVVLVIYGQAGIKVATIASHEDSLSFDFPKGLHKIDLLIENLSLEPGTYGVQFKIASFQQNPLFFVESDIISVNIAGRIVEGFVNLKRKWQVQ